MGTSRYILLAALVGLVIVVCPMGSAAPKPEIDSPSWELEVEFHDPQRISVTPPGATESITYWYMLYTVTNQSGRDVEFYPGFQLVTDTFQIITGGDDISPRVFDAIRARHKKLYPFFVDPTKVNGPLLQGEDNSRTSAAVFRDVEPTASRFTLYAGGFSGEIRRLKNPAFDASKPESPRNSPFFTLRKTLAITYDLPGDEQSSKLAVPTRVRKEWVIR